MSSIGPRLDTAARASINKENMHLLHHANKITHKKMFIHHTPDHGEEAGGGARAALYDSR